MPRLLLKNSALFVFCVTSAGCEVDYLAHLAAGQLERLGRLIPIEEAVNDQKLSQQERDKLATIQQIRQFAIDVIGLTPGDAYTLFEPSVDGGPAAWVLIAGEPDSLTPFRWFYPIVGELTQKGFFDEAMGQREADALAADGYDVYYTPVDGFSTLGFFPDPIRQSNLRLDEIELAEFLLHEMTHATVFKPSDNDFNEAMATFVGRAAAQAWFNATFGMDSEIAQSATWRYADKGVIDEYVVALFNSVQAYYAEAAAAGETREQIIAGREAVFAAAASRFETEFSPRLNQPDRWAFVGEIPLDNARILAGIRYQSGLEDFADVLKKTGGSFPDALAVFAEAAQAPDSRTFLRRYAAGAKARPNHENSSVRAPPTDSKTRSPLEKGETKVSPGLERAIGRTGNRPRTASHPSKLTCGRYIPDVRWIGTD